MLVPTYYSAIDRHTKLKISVDVAKNNIYQILKANQELKMATRANFKLNLAILTLPEMKVGVDAD